MKLSAEEEAADTWAKAQDMSRAALNTQVDPGVGALTLLAALVIEMQKTNRQLDELSDMIAEVDVSLRTVLREMERD